jgi:hypothetical protein
MRPPGQLHHGHPVLVRGHLLLLAPMTTSGPLLQMLCRQGRAAFLLSIQRLTIPRIHLSLHLSHPSDLVLHLFSVRFHLHHTIMLKLLTYPQMPRYAPSPCPRQLVADPFTHQQYPILVHHRHPVGHLHMQAQVTRLRANMDTQFPAKVVTSTR